MKKKKIFAKKIEEKTPKSRNFPLGRLILKKKCRKKISTLKCDRYLEN